MQKQDRVFPVLVTIVGAFIVFYFSRNLPYSNIVRQFYLIMVIMLSGFMIVTIRWKISMHMTASGGYHVLIKHDPYIALSQLGGE